MIKLAAAEADLISASIHGPAAVYGELLVKLAALELDHDDRLAIIDALETEEAKTELKVADFLTPGVLKALALGSLIASPVAAGVSALRDHYGKINGLERARTAAPEVFENPARGEAFYNLLYSAAPGVAKNTPVAADLLRQMHAQPALDIGTVGRMSEIRKNMAPKDSSESLVSSVSTAVPAIATILANKTANVALDGTKTFFNWGTEAIKAAGLTDAFSGSGSPMQQANQAFSMGQQTQQYPLMPLDAIVRELMAKEQELMQREDMIAQQEQMLAQAQGTQGQMSSAYRDEFGVDPTTGAPLQPEDIEGSVQDEQDHHQGPNALPEGSPEDQQADAALAAQMSATGEQPVPAAMPQQDPAAAMPPQDPAAAMPPQDPAAELPPQDPAAAMQDPSISMPAQDPTVGMPAQDPSIGMPAQDPGIGMPAQDPSIGMPMPQQPAAPMVTPDGAGGMTISIPLPSIQLSLKLAEADRAQDAIIRNAVSNLFRG